MKIYPTVSVSSLLFRGLVISGVACGLFACAGATDFLTSALLPARGNVSIKTDRNDHYIIHVNLRNLVQAEKLNPARKSYVVWMESDRGIIKNIGQLHPSLGFYSGMMKAKLKPESPLKPSRIYITAEDNPDVQFSHSDIVFATTDFQE